MAQINNLNADDVLDLENTLLKMQESSPEITWSFHEQKGKINTEKAIDHVALANQIALVEEKVDKLHAMIKQIFGGSVLINGKWIKLG